MVVTGAFIHWREVLPEDKSRILQWRNSKHVAEYMYTDHHISVDEHEAWFQGITGDPTRRYWIIQCDGQDIGLVNIYGLDRRNKRCSWAFYVADPNSRGKGVGSRVEYLVLSHVFEDLGLNRLCCEVVATNEAVTKMHKSFGFKEEGHFRQHVQKDGEWVDVIYLAMLGDEWQRQKPAIERRLRQKGLLQTAPERKGGVQ